MAIVLVLSVLSGAAALVFEAVFLRQCTWLLGSSVTATALVLSAFLGGMAAGAALLGRVADRHPRPLRLYGLIEAGVGLSGGGVVWLLSSRREWLQAPLQWIGPGGASEAVGFFLALALLLAPAFLIGATLPALSRFLVRGSERFLGRLGLLYALNTLGGAAGALLAGFVLFEKLGISGSGAFAAILDLGVGAGALAIDRTRRPSSEGSRQEAGSPAPGTAHGSGAARSSGSAGLRRVCFLAAGLGGFAALGYEVLWTRLLSLPLRSYSYSFTLMLGLFLAGIVLGGLVVAAASRRIHRPAEALGWVQLGMGLSVAASILWSADLLGSPIEGGGFAGFVLKGALRAGAIILPPTILSGIAFPLAARAVASDAGGVGRTVGAVYAVNTLGAVLGALLTRFALLPSLGASRSLAVLATLNAASGALVVLAATRLARRDDTAGAPQPRRTTEPRRGRSVPVGRGSAAPRRDASSWIRPGAAILIALACAGSIGISRDRFVRAFLDASRAKEKIAGLLFFHEGATDTIAIVKKNYGFYDPEAKTLITNAISMSATARPVWRYMAVEGHLPALLSREPKRALVLCVGTGITLGAVASHPGIVSIDAVDLSEGVMQGLPYFAAENGRAWEDPRVRLVRQDGRHFLELGREPYDAITLEPPPPIVAGSAHLYSLEFYRACLRRLAPGGVVAQWLPLHSQSLESARMTARTFAAAFPHAQLWLPSVRDAVLVGSVGPLSLDPARARRAWSEPKTRANLAAAYLESPEAFLGTFLLDRDGLLRWAGGEAPDPAGSPIGRAAAGGTDGAAVSTTATTTASAADDRRAVLTDEHPWMEFFRMQGRNMKDRDIASLTALPQSGRGWISGIETDPGLESAIETENRALRLYLKGEIEENAAASAAAARAARGTEFFLSTLGCASGQLAFMARTPQWSAMAEGQRSRCERLLAAEPGAAATPH